MSSRSSGALACHGTGPEASSTRASPRSPTPSPSVVRIHASGAALASSNSPHQSQYETGSASRSSGSVQELSDLLPEEFERGGVEITEARIHHVRVARHLSVQREVEIDSLGRPKFVVEPDEIA